MKRTRDLTEILSDSTRLPSGRVWLQIMGAYDDAADAAERQAEREAERHGLHVTRDP